VSEPTLGYAITVAPLIVKDKVIVGTAGGEYGIRGFISALDAKTGKEAWRFYTIPGPGEPGHESWTGGDPANDSWRHGGASVWVTGSYDSELNLTYWGIGNPGPDYNDDERPGDNLYSDSVVALDADTGQLKWHFQFTPHDVWDYDSVQIPVLADIEWQGRQRKAMFWANRNGFFYVLDRATGEFLRGAPFAKVTWATGLDARGRPLVDRAKMPTREGVQVFPGVSGATNWYSPSYSPATGLFYIPTWLNYSSIFTKFPIEYEPGQRYTGGSPRSEVPGLRRPGPINTRAEADGSGAIRAIDPLTGEQKWEFAMTDVTDAGILTTASGLVFAGGREGYFYALDARSGRELWRASLGGQVTSAPITYRVGNRQFVSVAAGAALFTFALPE
jgi:alcohol dehydrogenase (cytochrome c)